MDIKSLLHAQWITVRFHSSGARAIKAFTAAILGTFIALLALVLYESIRPKDVFFSAYTKLAFTPHLGAMVVVIMLGFVGMLMLSAKKLWRSFQLGLLPISISTWIVCIALFWLLVGLHHPIVGTSILVACALVSFLINIFVKHPQKPQGDALEYTDPDLPVPENGQDLLGLGDLIDRLVGMIVLERPLTIAVTGPYGHGKTSFVNLAVGRVRSLEEEDRPIIVRFSPWLAADPNALILSLLSSIVVEMEKVYFIPGLKRDTFDYARSLLSAIPKLHLPKQILSESSQEDHIARLASRISATQRRILVVLDDLDRLQSTELETVFKILRASDAFMNLTFVCCFDRTELVSILQVTRPHQNINTFIEKFFQSAIRLPAIDSLRLRDFFASEVRPILHRYSLTPLEPEINVTELCEQAVKLYLVNLRRIKLFTNRLGHSLARIGSEVNTEDFIRLELVREMAPMIYQTIYNEPEYFYEAALAFESQLTGPLSSDAGKARKQRAEFYEEMLKTLPAGTEGLPDLLEALFPRFAEYRGKPLRPMDPLTMEKEKRIFHPRCFRQYFLLKVPSELFSRREFDKFLASIRSSTEAGATGQFNEVFRSMGEEGFKRWHFVHQIEMDFDSLSMKTSRGLCRGFAQNSHSWTSDAFESMSAIDCTRKTLRKMTTDSERESFIVELISESSSMLYAFFLVNRLVMDSQAEVQLHRGLIQKGLKREMHTRYMIKDAPSVFEQLRTEGGRIDPIWLLMEWRRLGADAESEQESYLLDLFGRRPADLNFFLRTMFRAEFLDDYTNLKPLIDYARLAELIKANASLLDEAKVQAFCQRYKAERSGTS